jgi:hypothetical protein
MSWLSAAQLKNLDDSIIARNTIHKSIIFEEQGAPASLVSKMMWVAETGCILTLPLINIWIINF